MPDETTDEAAAAVDPQEAAQGAAEFIAAEVQKAVGQIEENLAGQLRDAMEGMNATVLKMKEDAEAANAQVNAATAAANPNAKPADNLMPSSPFRSLRGLAADAIEKDPMRLLAEGADIFLDNIWKGVSTYLNFKAAQSNPFSTVEGIFGKYPDMKKIYSTDPFGNQASQMYAQFHQSGWNAAMKAMTGTGQIPPGGAGLPPDPLSPPSPEGVSSPGVSFVPSVGVPPVPTPSVAPMSEAYAQVNGTGHPAPPLKLADVW